VTVALDRILAFRRDLILDEMTSTLRHDLRNKFAAVRNAALYIRRRVEQTNKELFEKDKRIPQFFGLMETELGAAESLVATRWALPEGNAEIAAIDASKTAAELLAIVPHPDNVRFEKVDPSDALVRAQSDEVAVAIYCLVENAVEAIGSSSGTVDVQCKLRSEGFVEIKVEDDGPGLVPGTELKALEQFFSTKPGRIGLGINVAERIAVRLGGALQIQRGKERGVAAVILLPSGATKDQ
jgi:signal transduction histidine kinase